MSPNRRWKQDLAPYLAIDRRRSLGQIASVVAPYLGVWVLAAIAKPKAWPGIQHQYEDTYYMAGEDWSFELAALQHHVHHLSAKIPNYHLRAAHEQQSLFADTQSSRCAAASPRCG